MRRLGLGLALAAILCTTAEAQRRRVPAPNAQQRQALTHAAGALLRRGYQFSEDGAGIAGSLDSGASWSSRFEFLPGQRIALVAVCDSNCANLVMQLTDLSGGTVARDTTSGARAVLEFTVSAPEYRLTITMASCSSNPCRWAFRSLSLP